MRAEERMKRALTKKLTKVEIRFADEWRLCSQWPRECSIFQSFQRHKEHFLKADLC